MNDEIKLTTAEKMRLASRKWEARGKVIEESKKAKQEKRYKEHEFAGKKVRQKKKKFDPLSPWVRSSGSAFNGKRR